MSCCMKKETLFLTSYEMPIGWILDLIQIISNKYSPFFFSYLTNFWGKAIAYKSIIIYPKKLQTSQIHNTLLLAKSGHPHSCAKNYVQNSVYLFAILRQCASCSNKKNLKIRVSKSHNCFVLKKYMLTY